MAIDAELRRLRPVFYQRVESLVGFQFDPDCGNHKDFSYNGYNGHVNWYFSDGLISRHGGNVCIVFKDIDTAHIVIPHPYIVPRNHPDWIMASSLDANNRNVDHAVNWIHEMADLFVNQNPRNNR